MTTEERLQYYSREDLIELIDAQEYELLKLREFVKKAANTKGLYVGAIRNEAKRLTPAEVVCENHIGPNGAGNCYVCGTPIKDVKKKQEKTPQWCIDMLEDCVR